MQRYGTPLTGHICHIRGSQKLYEAAHPNHSSPPVPIYYQQNRPNTVNVTDSHKTVRRKASETLTTSSAGRETSKASPSTHYRPTPDREAVNHKTLGFQIQPARHPQMRRQHHVQPLTITHQGTPKSHMSDIAARQQTTTKPAAATHQLLATETTLEGAQKPSKTVGL